MANIIITGANQGIGYYFTEQALKDGNKVAVLDVETDKLEVLTLTICSPPKPMRTISLPGLVRSGSAPMACSQMTVCGCSSKKFLRN